jgi:hypothetical protein
MRLYPENRVIQLYYIILLMLFFGSVSYQDPANLLVTAGRADIISLAIKPIIPLSAAA